MKNKKGFTLVEIIICVSLIAAISTISIVIFTINKDSSNMTKKILEAANVYIATEKDEQGNTYEYGINNGGKGVRINVSELVNKGYVDEKIYKTLEKEYKLGDDKSYLIWITNSIKGSTDKECGANALEYTVNWETKNGEGNVVYLCPYNSNKSSDELILINKLLKQGYNTNCENSLETNSLCLSHGKNISDDENLEDIYYFKGKVDNNYIKFKGLDKLFRIVRTTENNGIKIIEDETFTLPENNVRSWGDYIRFYSSYKNTKNINHITLDHYSITNYRPNYDCYCNPSDTKVINSWDDSSETTLNCYLGDGAPKQDCPATVSLKSPIYQYLYLPIKNHYEEDLKSVLEKYINKNYKWCGFNFNSDNKNNLTNFKCSNEKSISTDFGLLTYQEYLRAGIYNPTHIKYKNDYLNLFDYEKSIEHELTLDNEVAKSPADTIISSNSYYVKVRVAYVIKNDIKILSGNGTKDEPYIIGEENE